MSLDIYLIGPKGEARCRCYECGHEHQRETYSTLFQWNITHNLGRMAQAAGVYEALWLPAEQGWKRAADLIPSLEAGLRSLQKNPEFFRAFSPSNGWGTYEGLTEAVGKYLAACIENPEAEVQVSR